MSRNTKKSTILCSTNPQISSIISRSRLAPQDENAFQHNPASLSQPATFTVNGSLPAVHMGVSCRGFKKFKKFKKSKKIK